MSKKRIIPTTNSVNEQPKPLWADGLQKMYAAVVAEPLPDMFETLLDQLEQKASTSKKFNDNV